MARDEASQDALALECDALRERVNELQRGKS
jgi:hypothetical protein